MSLRFRQHRLYHQLCSRLRTRLVRCVSFKCSRGCRSLRGLGSRTRLTVFMESFGPPPRGGGGGGGGGGGAGGGGGGGDRYGKGTREKVHNEEGVLRDE